MWNVNTVEIGRALNLKINGVAVFVWIYHQDLGENLCKDFTTRQKRSICRQTGWRKRQTVAVTVKRSTQCHVFYRGSRRRRTCRCPRLGWSVSEPVWSQLCQNSRNVPADTSREQREFPPECSVSGWGLLAHCTLHVLLMPLWNVKTASVHCPHSEAQTFSWKNKKKTSRQKSYLHCNDWIPVYILQLDKETQREYFQSGVALHPHISPPHHHFHTGSASVCVCVLNPDSIWSGITSVLIGFTLQLLHAGFPLLLFPFPPSSSLCVWARLWLQCVD